MREAIPPLPNTSSWRGAWLRTGKTLDLHFLTGLHNTENVATSFRLALGSTKLPIQWVPGALSPGVRRPGSEADHSPPSSVEVNNAWSHAYTPHGVVLIGILNGVSSPKSYE